MDERRRTVATRVALALGSFIVLCLGLAVVGLWYRPRQFTTHNDAIGAALVQHGIAYQTLYINHTWPETLNTERFAANLELILPTGRRVPGYLACRSGRTTCVYSFASLGIDREALPDLVKERRQPWLTWVEQQIGAIAGNMP